MLTRIDALRTGEIHPVERGEITEHLKSCPSCDESVDDIERLAHAVKSLALAPPRSCAEAIRDRFDSVSAGGRTVRVAFSDRGIRMIWGSRSEDEFRAEYTKRYGRALQPAAIPEALRRQVEASLTGGETGKPRLDIETSDLEREVLHVLAKIPRGEVRSYTWLAEQVGRPRAVRAVANVVARNFVPFLVPCHRVVPAGGGVGKYAFGSAAKRELLRREGVDVDALDDLARRNVRFIGSKTTRIFCFPTCRDARRIREDNRVPFHGSGEAMEKGFRPCRRCQPVAA